MEIETPSSITFEKLLSYYSYLNQPLLEQTSKTIDKRILLEVMPPFIIVHFDPRDELEVDFEQLVEIWNTYLNKGFPKNVIKFGKNNIFYVTRYEDGIMIAKNQDDESIYFVGKFGIGEVVLFSHASANVEKITRLKTLMSLYNVIAPKAKQQIEKKK